MTHRELKRQVTALVSGDELEKAAKLLATYYEGHETSVAVALIAGRLEALNQGLANGLMEFPEYYQARNQLRVGILQLLDGEGLPNKPGLISRYRATLAQAAVLLILIKETEKGLAITPIHKVSQIKSRKYIVGALQELAENDLVEKIKAEKTTYWKLSEKGRKLAQEFEASLGPLLG